MDTLLAEAAELLAVTTNLNVTQTHNIGDNIQEGDVIVILEAMKMETEVRATKAGTVVKVNVSEGNSVAVGETLISVS